MAAFSAVLLLTALVATFVCARLLACLLMAARGAGRDAVKRETQRCLAGFAQLVGRIAPVARSVEKSRELRRQALFQRQMPDALRLLSLALDAGSSLPKALAYAAENVEEPLAGELKRTVWDLRVGQGFDEAMAHLRERTGGSEFAYLAVAMEIQHRCGGSLTDVLQSISASLHSAAELSEKLRTQTVQGRLSARIVAAMPLAVLGVFSLLSPGYLAGFVSVPAGALLLALAVLLEAVGVLWVRRTLSIDLSAHGGGDAS